MWAFQNHNFYDQQLVDSLESQTPVWIHETWAKKELFEMLTLWNNRDVDETSRVQYPTEIRWPLA